MQRLRQWARRLKQETLALYLAVQHRSTPWYARAWAALVVGYALSPVDLIPDFIPILGYLDDLILVPAGIALAVRLIPPAVMDEYRTEAQIRLEGGRPKSWVGALVILLIWVTVLLWVGSRFL